MRHRLCQFSFLSENIRGSEFDKTSVSLFLQCISADLYHDKLPRNAVLRVQHS